MRRRLHRPFLCRPNSVRRVVTDAPPTRELEVSDFAPGGPVEYLARERVEQIGKSFAFLSASPCDASNTLIAEGASTAKPVPYRDLGRPWFRATSRPGSTFGGVLHGAARRLQCPP